MLLAEAVVASFLMIFAFLASASLYDASLRWEAGSASLRRATLLAEQKMEEIRARASSYSPPATFASHLDGIISGPHPPSPEAPDFRFAVRALDNTHRTVASSGLTPSDGVHSPCSTFFTRPGNPGSTDRSASPYAASDPGGDFQRNVTYESYPYSRRMSRSFRLVQVTVSYGVGYEQKVDLISLIGDPILPPARPAAGADNLNLTLNVIRESGSVDLSAPGAEAVYRIDVTTDSGTKVEEVSALWSIHPLSSGTADIFALDASGLRVRVTRSADSKAGTTFRLFPQIRYEGVEARATSDAITL